MPRCVIQGISHDGQGVGRIDGLAVFVPGALPGETVEIEVVQIRKRFARGKLKQVIEAVPERVNPPCQYFDDCGGCAYQHASYPHQLHLKTTIVEQTLQRIGGISTLPSPCLASPLQWRYRNKVTWHAVYTRNCWQMGYFAADGNNILPIKNCLLISAAMQDLSNRFSDFLGQIPSVEGRLELVVRQSSLTGELMMLLSGLPAEYARKLADLFKDQAVSVAAVEGTGITSLAGHITMEDAIEDIRYRFGRQAFFQVNPAQTKNLIAIVKQLLHLRGDETILDAYCGVGTIALHLAPHARQVVGVECFAPAVLNAKQNARLNGFRNCRFLAGAAEVVLPTLTNRFDAVVLDPPRSGCHPQVIRAVSRMNIPSVVYVSCEPSTLARDLKLFREAGYEIHDIRPLDMFPWTRHVETIVALYRG